MESARSLNHEGKRPGIPLLAKVLCHFSRGETRRLYATHLSMDGAFILSMQPPPLDTSVVVTLYPRGHLPLPPIVARVYQARVDPRNAEHSGFGILFSHFEKGAHEALHGILAVLGLLKPDEGADSQFKAEQRIHPRVVVNLRALVEMASETVPMRILNLSMSGALLGFGEQERSPGVIPGIVGLHVLSAEGPERITLQAEVVRMCKGDEPGDFGVRFLALDAEATSRLEGLILDSLVG